MREVRSGVKFGNRAPVARQLSLIWHTTRQNRKLGSGLGSELSQYVCHWKPGAAVELAPLEKNIHKKNLLVQILLGSSVRED